MGVRLLAFRGKTGLVAKQDQLQQATEAIKAGHKKTARQLLHQIVQAEPNNEIAWLRLATITGDLNQQHQLLERVLALNPGNEPALRRIKELEQMRQVSN